MCLNCKKRVEPWPRLDFITKSLPLFPLASRDSQWNYVGIRGKRKWIRRYNNQTQRKKSNFSLGLKFSQKRVSGESSILWTVRDAAYLVSVTSFYNLSVSWYGSFFPTRFQNHSRSNEPCVKLDFFGNNKLALFIQKNLRSTRHHKLAASDVIETRKRFFPQSDQAFLNKFQFRHHDKSLTLSLKLFKSVHLITFTL